MLNGPVSHIPIPQFPADIRLSVYAHVTGGHGSYPLTFQLCAADGEAVWQWQPAAPLYHPDRLTPQQLAFHELTVSMETPGRYDMVLLAGEHEIGQQLLMIGPAEVFQGDGA